MGLDVFSPLEGYRQDSMGAGDPATEITPDGLFSNLPGAVGKGITGGLAAVGRTVSDFAMQAGKQEMMEGLVMNPQVTPEQIQELENLKPAAPYDDQLKSVQQWSRLDPRTTGAGSMVLGQTARGLTIFGMGSLMGGVPGGAATLGVTEGYNNYLDLRDAGVDEKTAGAAAATTGTMAALGAYLPVKMTGALARGALGAAMSAEAAGAGTAARSLYTVAGLSAAASSSIVGNAAYSSLVNTGFGMASRALTSGVLEAGGYPEMARQYKALDGEAIAADAILGLAFGGWAHVEGNAARRATPEARPPEPMVESALEVRREEQINRGAAGIPSDPVTGALDRELQDRSVAEVLQGKTPEIAPAEARQVLDGSIVDPEKVRLAQDIESAAKIVHGDLADPTPPVMRPEAPAARTQIETVAPTERPAGEATGPSFEPATQATIDQLAARHPDLDIELPDGSTVKASELPQRMQQMMTQAESDAKLHDVAVACFLRTL